jgi:hypothetical protein
MILQFLEVMPSPKADQEFVVCDSVPTQRYGPRSLGLYQEHIVTCCTVVNLPSL